MSATPFDSPLHRGLFGDKEIAPLFTATAEVRAMLIVEGALAQVQGAQGMIPAVSAAAIARAAMEIQIDPAALADGVATSGVSVPALIQTFRSEMNAPEHAQYVHFGATSQDIIDTGLALRLRRVMHLFETRLRSLLSTLARLAEERAETAMLARTWGHAALPTSLGALISSCALPLLHAYQGLSDVKDRLTLVSLSGAAGTASALGPNPEALRKDLAKALDLSDPETSWHTVRTGPLHLAQWATTVTTALAKLGEDTIALTASGGIALTGSGSSSTMPQKQNPVGPSLLVALANHTNGLGHCMALAARHRAQRDGAAWMTEWLTLPQLCLTTGRALTVAHETAQALTADTDALMSEITAQNGLIYAEALQFTLAERMPRPDAQAAVKMLCQEVRASGQDLETRARARYADLPTTLFTAKSQLGTAPKEARAVAKAIREALA